MHDIIEFSCKGASRAKSYFLLIPSFYRFASLRDSSSGGGGGGGGSGIINIT